jgi:extracellular elastinolytic metalloproteinase
MPRSLDTRDFSFVRQRDNTAEAARISNFLSGNHRVGAVRVNPFTGSTDRLISINAPTTFAAVAGKPSDAALIETALQHVQNASSALGFEANQPAEFIPDPVVKETSYGDRIVNLQQTYRGIPVFQMARTIAFRPDGSVQSTTGSSVGISPDMSTRPLVSAEDAVKAAAAHLAEPEDDVDAWTKERIRRAGMDISTYQPEILGRVALPSQPTVVSRGPFAFDIPVHLVMFYQGATTRLGWHMMLTMPERDAQYAVIVEADEKTEKKEAPKILYCKQTSHDVMRVRGDVWAHNPGIDPQRQTVDFPRGIAEYPIDAGGLTIPDPQFPRSWVDDGDSATRGNCTIAVSGYTTNSVSGTVGAGGLLFNVGPDQGDDQKVVNIFYFCNLMHDFYYMLGFDERYNFQKINYTGVGAGGDSVVARAHPGPVQGTANMSTLPDGTSPEMNMGLVRGINRHTAFDSDVVFHEFTHGVTNRMVGAVHDARSLEEPQSQGMGEGWSDYFALTFQNCLGLIKDPGFAERNVIGDWVADQPPGIRMHPYDDNYPGTFGMIAAPPYSTDEHAIGEIWCATLMKINRDFGQVLGGSRDARISGHRIGWQMVVDALLLTQSSPSMLDARDAILQALDRLSATPRVPPAAAGALRRKAWSAFARFGMGPNARSVGATLEGIVEDTSVPPEV